MEEGVDIVWLLQVGSAFVLNCGFSWLAGSWWARRWLPAGAVRPAAFEARLRTLDLLAAGVAIAACGLSLLAATAVMGGTGLREACAMFWVMATSTAYGRSGCVAVAALAAVLALRCVRRLPSAVELAVLLCMGIFAVTRSSMGHAGEQGLWSLPMAAESIHLSAISVWAGIVAVSGCLVLPVRWETDALQRYLGWMSHAATAALAAIAMTGIYSGWHRVGSTGNLIYTVYGLTLLSKVALVLLAIGIGGYNKFIGLPAASRSAAGVAVVRLALRIETVLLLGAILAAALLTSQQPPTAI
ncbi:MULTISPECIES: copper resistance D family protein [unclassified Duganella]|uniref:copper resistance D family protein n=1 Tax=unclassified Duganella TaxID=2636909 RepID=UPI000E352173|nr:MULTISPECIES: CopD family protein [unclassified Duganella]RFP08137.1 copper resistance protein CopD [Duganella sp. BJB475]RFP36182.1 copper resistance protein CopD [Duganella sp. BJB476]